MSGSSKASWIDGVQRIHDEAAGLLTLDVVRQDDVPGLIGAALAGDADTGRLLIWPSGRAVDITHPMAARA